MEDDNSLSFEVSGMNQLEQLLDETKPHFCIDATNNTLESVFPHFRRLLAKGINILTLSTDAIFPNTRFYWKPLQLFRSLDQVAKESNAVILGGGYSDSLLMPIIPSMTASMIKLNGVRGTIKINVDMEHATKKFIQDAGVGMTEEEFNENEGAHVRKIGYWTRAIVESIADGIGYPLLDKTYGKKGESIALFTRTECYKVQNKEGLKCEGLDAMIDYGKCAGMNITVKGEAKDDMEIVFSVILAVLPQQSEENDLKVVLHGIPELEFSIKNVDSFMASAASLLHRVPLVLNELEPGFYNVNHLKSNSYWDRVSDWNKDKVKEEMTESVKLNEEEVKQDL